MDGGNLTPMGIVALRNKDYGMLHCIVCKQN